MIITAMTTRAIQPPEAIAATSSSTAAAMAFPAATTALAAAFAASAAAFAAAFAASAVFWRFLQQSVRNALRPVRFLGQS